MEYKSIISLVLLTLVLGLATGSLITYSVTGRFASEEKPIIVSEPEDIEQVAHFTACEYCLAKKVFGFQGVPILKGYDVEENGTNCKAVIRGTYGVAEYGCSRESMNESKEEMQRDFRIWAEDFNAEQLGENNG